jgi:hypothetical protein
VNKKHEPLILTETISELTYIRVMLEIVKGTDQPFEKISYRKIN